ncbi:5-methyltetrahydrofolate:corrinoid/iron-sulfur protein co-methyltransferase [subsurface metagenome]
MIVIGERINASNKTVGEAIAKRDSAFIARLATAQTESGADFIDVNAGGQQEHTQGKASMKWLVDTVQAVTDKPLAIDSDRPEIIEAALQTYRGEEMFINSVTAEPAKLATIGPLAAEHQAWLVALAMGTDGIPDNVEQRLEACEKIATHLTQMGVKMEQIFFDPLVLPIAVDSSQGLVTLKTIEEIKSRYPDARTVVGLSNISYGLPNRKLVNRAFLLMAVHAGLDAAILDPLDIKMMSMVKVADMLTGKDVSCRTYIRAHRRGIIVD